MNRLLQLTYPEKSGLLAAFVRYELAHAGLVVGALMGDRLVGMSGTFPRTLTYGRARVAARQAGLGVVEPRFRGRGYFGRVLAAVLAAEFESGAAISIGYSARGEEYAAAIGSVTLGVPEAQFSPRPLAAVPSSALSIRPAQLPTDLRDLMRLYDEFPLHTTGTVVRDEGYWRAHLSWTGEDPTGFLVALDGQRVIAYMRSRVKGLEQRRILEAIYADGYETAAVTLFGRIEQSSGGTLWKFAAPVEHSLMQFVIEAREARIVESRSMGVRLISRSRLREQTAPELRARVAVDPAIDELPEPANSSDAEWLRTFFTGTKGHLAGAFPERTICFWHSDRM